MPQPRFFDENLNRSFPFVTNTDAELPHDIIVDCGFTMGLYSNVDPSNEVRLKSIELASSIRTFTFVCSKYEGIPLKFHVGLGDKFATIYSDSDLETSCRPPIWSGYIIVADPAKITSNLNFVERPLVEPALIHNLSGSYINDFNLANHDRTRAKAPAVTGSIDEDNPCGPYAIPDVNLVRARCVQGNIWLKEGYNCQITQNANNNSITIAARRGYGEGEPLAEVPLDNHELADIPVDEHGCPIQPLSGGPWCKDTLRSINGLGGPILNLMAGPGVSVTADPDLSKHKIVVNVNMLGLVKCFDDMVTS